MTDERERRLFKLLEAALESPAATRPVALDRLCEGDEPLRRQLEALLALEEEAEQFLPDPVLAHERPEEFQAGARVGPYRILELLGRGGMGSVYRAVREEDFEKPVAIKVIRRDLPGVLTVRRFHAERQILARLEHPGIARLLDGGATADGGPYLVMEYVEGVPIADHCDAHRLGIRRRLELFLQVLEVLAYAHRNLVVHRDLKPDNILVTAGGAIKLLDFGIAKLLDPSDALSSGVTLPAQRPMTLRYASPEQVRREPITTASDVYSLGVVLYQLLTGESPYRVTRDSWPEMVKAVCESEPQRPSAAVAEASAGGLLRARQLAGDVDAIVLKALRKEPQHRYASVEQFAADVRRHLRGRPVRARKGTWAYRTGKLVVRHKAAVAVALLILAFSVASTVLWRRAESQRAAAVRERTRAERISEFLTELFQSTDPDAAQGATLPAREILDQARTRLTASRDDEPELEADLTATLAHVYRDLGLHEEAVELLEHAVRIRRRLHPEGHPELTAVLVELARTRSELAAESP